jgi:hypothetical protein
VSSTLLSYPTSSSAPWPADKPDKQLCQLLLQLQQSSLEDNSGSQQQLVKLPGGMCLFAHQAAGKLGDDASSAAAAGLFKDLEGLELSASDVAEGTSMSDSGAEPNQEQQQQQQVQQVEVVQWGNWAKAAAAAATGARRGDGNYISSNTDSLTDDLAVSAAHLLLHVWDLHQQAEQLASNGCAAAAVKLYQQALAAADGGTSSSTATHSTSSAVEHAFAAGASSSIGSGGGSKVVLGARHILRARVNAGLLKAAVDEGRSWEVALAAAQALTPVYELVYPKVGRQLQIDVLRVASAAVQCLPPST